MIFHFSNKNVLWEKRQRNLYAGGKRFGQREKH